jgi:hypothetical protein
MGAELLLIQISYTVIGLAYPSSILLDGYGFCGRVLPDRSGSSTDCSYNNWDVMAVTSHRFSVFVGGENG